VEVSSESEPEDIDGLSEV